MFNCFVFQFGKSCHSVKAKRNPKKTDGYFIMGVCWGRVRVGVCVVVMCLFFLKGSFGSKKNSLYFYISTLGSEFCFYI